jgi:hypothetical protein
VALTGCGASGPGGAGGAAGNGGPAITPTTVKALRTSPPEGNPIVYLKGVVIVARVAISTAGELWVQDPGGGLGSGILIYCDYSGTIQPCSYDRTAWKQFRRGQVVDVLGVFHKRTPTGAPATAQQLRLESPTITVGTATMDPVATPVSAADVEMMQLGTEMAKGSYVSVAGPVTISSLMPAEFLTTCPGAATGSAADHIVGFEAKVGPSVLAVGLNLYETISYCVQDTCTGSPCTNPIKSQTWSRVLGIVEPRYSATGTTVFMRLSPTVDADLVP